MCPVKDRNARALKAGDLYQTEAHAPSTARALLGLLEGWGSHYGITEKPRKRTAPNPSFPVSRNKFRRVTREQSRIRDLGEVLETGTDGTPRTRWPP